MNSDDDQYEGMDCLRADLEESMTLPDRLFNPAYEREVLPQALPVPNRY